MRLPHLLALALLASSVFAQDEVRPTRWNPVDREDRLRPGAPPVEEPLFRAHLEAAGPLEPIQRGPEPLRIEPAASPSTLAASSPDGTRGAWLWVGPDGQHLTTGPLPAGPWRTWSVDPSVPASQIAFAGDQLVYLGDEGPCVLSKDGGACRPPRQALTEVKWSTAGGLELPGEWVVAEAEAESHALSPDGDALWYLDRAKHIGLFNPGSFTRTRLPDTNPPPEELRSAPFPHVIGAGLGVRSLDGREVPWQPFATSKVWMWPDGTPVEPKPPTGTPDANAARFVGSADHRGELRARDGALLDQLASWTGYGYWTPAGRLLLLTGPQFGWWGAALRYARVDSPRGASLEPWGTRVWTSDALLSGADGSRVPDGATSPAASWSGREQLRVGRADLELASTQLPVGEPTELLVSPDGRSLLVFADLDASVWRIDLETLQPTLRVTEPRRILGVSGLGDELAIATTHGLSVRDARTLAEVEFLHAEEAWAYVLTPEGIVGHADGMLLSWDREGDLNVARRFSSTSWGAELYATPDGVALRTADDRWREFNPNLGLVFREGRLDAPEPDPRVWTRAELGRRAGYAVELREDWVRVVGPDPCEPLCTFRKGHPGGESLVAMSETLLILGGRNGGIQFRDLRDGRWRGELELFCDGSWVLNTPAGRVRSVGQNHSAETLDDLLVHTEPLELQLGAPVKLVEVAVENRGAVERWLRLSSESRPAGLWVVSAPPARIGPGERGVLRAAISWRPPWGRPFDTAPVGDTLELWVASPDGRTRVELPLRLVAPRMALEAKRQGDAVQLRVRNVGNAAGELWLQVERAGWPVTTWSHKDAGVLAPGQFRSATLPIPAGEGPVRALALVPGWPAAAWVVEL